MSKRNGDKGKDKGRRIVFPKRKPVKKGGTKKGGKNGKK